MFGLLICGLIAAAVVVTLFAFVDYLSSRTAGEQIADAAHHENKYGYIQAIIDSVGDDCATFSLSRSGRQFANLQVSYNSKASDIYVGRKIGVHA